MWIYVMFDLPTGTKKERYEANKFRNRLLDLGFLMVQFSVYNKYCSGKEAMESIYKKIDPFVPQGGYVDMLSFTDKQYEKMVRYESKIKSDKTKDKGQLVLF